MEIVTTIATLRARLALSRKAGQSIGFVPTMGYLHKGHLTLVERSRAENPVNVVSIFVNPLQFGRGEDLEKYPRDLERDAALLDAAGVDVLFAPEVKEMYPRPMQTVVDLPELGGELEGAARPGHFAGVATVVSKLFNIVQPDAAYFGLKDYQQVAIIRRMVEDMAIPVRIVPVETVREVDGLAFSSRNVYLSREERAAAVIVPRALDEAERLHRAGLNDPEEMETTLTAFIASEPLARPGVISVRHPDTLAPLQRLDQSFLVLLYVEIGTTKLLDNRVIEVAANPGSQKEIIA
ncbi:pantoate--beta-alanine ligase [Allorhizobium taibaishanense]|uniref:Pantothenate synthetase n=1 Tax=Allorhizobium taibaishanense TaxID=887144 RepID=A0A1Q9A3E7_9HYPH|nr:pantoate--beta-alanine ligase [Allorhizobium taibaishanense]MBB4006120.1 pantoate--beta-alanine ligase [Allorhizobium taibaishanense]OLP49120.1 pantoate--beta-alanine ligase [Allorhizobium taibaishanense]